MAHAMKKPVVATRVDGNAEVVTDGENGFLVPPRNPKELAEKVIYLLPHPVRWERGALRKWANMTTL